MPSGDDPGILQLLGRQCDQAVDLLCGVFAAGRIRVADCAIAFSRVREPIQGYANAHEAAMRVVIPPIGLDPFPRFVDWIHESEE
ncbi:MAG: hypothetical protein OEN21_00210 [Myxococcales bacterium]|nr:hypothetical protein [Myxococcales bacterium]